MCALRLFVFQCLRVPDDTSRHFFPSMRPAGAISKQPWTFYRILRRNSTRVIFLSFSPLPRSCSPPAGIKSAYSPGDQLYWRLYQVPQICQIRKVYRELYFDINNIFGTVSKFRLRYAPAKLEKLTFCSAYFYFGTTILNFDSFSLSYHIVRTQIAKVTASFSLFALAELVCTKKLPYPIY